VWNSALSYIWPGHYTKNSDEALIAAEDFESAVFSSVPKSKQFISYFDIDIADGHMMLIAQDNLLRASQKVQHEIYQPFLIFGVGPST